MANNLVASIDKSHLQENTASVISEQVAYQIIEKKGKILMIFERPDASLYGYIATQVTDLGHAKKVTVNSFVRFEKITTP